WSILHLYFSPLCPFVHLLHKLDKFIVTVFYNQCGVFLADTVRHNRTDVLLLGNRPVIINLKLLWFILGYADIYLNMRVRTATLEKLVIETYICFLVDLFLGDIKNFLFKSSNFRILLISFFIDQSEHFLQFNDWDRSGKFPDGTPLTGEHIKPFCIA